MQDITTKLARIANALKAAGLTSDQGRHLIHGTGGSPRRAKRAIKLGIHDQLIAAYTAALAETGAHATAVIACNKLWADLVPSTPVDADEEADEEAEAPAAAAPAPKRQRKPVAQQIAEQAVAAASTTSRTRRKVAAASAAAEAAKPGVADLKALLPA